jgi:2-polyprenyl-3-methyl-5-hydroxy-6-metoxy-1,4-benzoquinol methylase
MIKFNPNDINAEFYDLIYADEKGDAVTSEECTLISSLAGEPTKSILDIGIGTGRHAIRLANMGYKITGIDLSKGMLKILNKKNIKGIKTVCADINKYKFPPTQKFDMVILMWNSFNEIALTKPVAKSLINKLISMLKPEGKIIINIERTLADEKYIPSFNFKKTIKGYGEVEVQWTNKWKSKDGSTTVSKEQIIVNGIKLKPAFIKQRWWTINDIKEMNSKVIRIENIAFKSNNERYITIQFNH